MRERSGHCCVGAPVPLFFFHVYDDDVTIDAEGAVLPDEGAAQKRAIVEARQLACHEVLLGHLGLHHRIEVTNDQGQVVASVEFGEAIVIDRSASHSSRGA